MQQKCLLIILLLHMQQQLQHHLMVASFVGGTASLTGWRAGYQYQDTNPEIEQLYPKSNHFQQNPQPEYQQQHEPLRQTRYSPSKLQQAQQQQQQGNRLSPATNYQQHQQQSGVQQFNNQQITRAGMSRANISIADRNQHKCRIWVPIETFSKYPWASSIQVDQANQLQLIEVCCPGFGAVRWRSNTHCRPICENCSNGYCVAPGQCQCYEEFVRNDNGDCVFTCPLACLNGRCYLDGSCQCDPGFKLDESRKFCRPICSTGCGLNPLHNCTEPEVCGCAKGYQLTDQGCHPTCQPECGIGGYCREFNVCECAMGYNLKDGVCQSDCYQKCDNGVCYGRNRCICNAGYKYHERSTQCIPI